MARLPIEMADVEAAAARLAGVAHHTPVVTSRTLDDLVGGTVALKAECFQRVGAFKFRGAYNAIAALDPDVRAAGVVTFSSGNHGQAVALSSRLHGVPATVVMPFDAPAAKRAATEGYGAEVVGYDRVTEDRDAIAAEIAAERGCTVIPPYDHPDVMAGQGTVALELLADRELDLLVAPVGGGGLIAGCATVAKARGGVEVIGVEPAASDDTQRSLAAGEIVEVPMPHTIADGQQLRRPGDLTFAVAKARLDAVALVSDAEIVAAMQFAFQRLNIVLEPSGASALAGLLSGAVTCEGRRVGVVLSGGNIDLGRFAELCG